MALLLPNSCFVHVPKTGGQAVRQALYDASYDVDRDRETGNKNLPYNRRAHCTADEARGEAGSRLIFGFVRHPIPWYRSYWAYRQANIWTIQQFDEERKAWKASGDDFDAWVGEITEKFPGFAYETFNRMLSGADYVGKTENLQSDLNKALMLAGDKTPVSVPESVNTSDNLPVLTEESMEKILRSEHRTLAWCGYDEACFELQADRSDPDRTSLTVGVRSS